MSDHTSQGNCLPDTLESKVGSLPREGQHVEGESVLRPVAPLLPCLAVKELDSAAFEILPVQDRCPAPV